MNIKTVSKTLLYKMTLYLDSKSIINLSLICKNIFVNIYQNEIIIHLILKSKVKVLRYQVKSYKSKVTQFCNSIHNSIESICNFDANNYFLPVIHKTPRYHFTDLINIFKKLNKNKNVKTVLNTKAEPEYIPIITKHIILKTENIQEVSLINKIQSKAIWVDEKIDELLEKFVIKPIIKYL